MQGVACLTDREATSATKTARFRLSLPQSAHRITAGDGAALVICHPEPLSLPTTHPNPALVHDPELAVQRPARQCTDDAFERSNQ